MERVMDEVGVRLALERVSEMGGKGKSLPAQENSWTGRSMAKACCVPASRGIWTHRSAREMMRQSGVQVLRAECLERSDSICLENGFGYLNRGMAC